MKKITLILAFILLINGLSFAQDFNEDYDEESRVNKMKFTIQTGPVLLFSDLMTDDDNYNDDAFLFAMDLEGQFLLSKYNSISLTLFLITANYEDNFTGNNRKFTNFIFIPMLVHKPFGTGIEGFYLGFYPSIGFIQINEDIKDHPLYTELGFGLKLGYKEVFSSGLTLQIGGGIGKNFTLNGKNPRNAYESDLMGYIFTSTSLIHFLDFKLGFSF